MALLHRSVACEHDYRTGEYSQHKRINPEDTRAHHLSQATKTRSRGLPSTVSGWLASSAILDLARMLELGLPGSVCGGEEQIEELVYSSSMGASY